MNAKSCPGVEEVESFLKMHPPVEDKRLYKSSAMGFDRTNKNGKQLLLEVKNFFFSQEIFIVWRDSFAAKFQGEFLKNWMQMNAWLLKIFKKIIPLLYKIKCKGFIGRIPKLLFIISKNLKKTKHLNILFTSDKMKH